VTVDSNRFVATFNAGHVLTCPACTLPLLTIAFGLGRLRLWTTRMGAFHDDLQTSRLQLPAGPSREEERETGPDLQSCVREAHRNSDCDEKNALFSIMRLQQQPRCTSTSCTVAWRSRSESGKVSYAAGVHLCSTTSARPRELFRILFWHGASTRNAL